MICIFGTKVGSGVFVNCALLSTLEHALLELVIEQSITGACLVVLIEKFGVVGN